MLIYLKLFTWLMSIVRKIFVVGLAVLTGALTISAIGSWTSMQAIAGTHN